MEEGRRMVHEGLRVCEECRRGECSYTKATPGCGWGDGGGRRQDEAEDRQSNIPWYTSPGNTLDLALSAHIAYSYWSLMAENVLNRAIMVKTPPKTHKLRHGRGCCFFLLKVDTWREPRLIFKSAEWINGPGTTFQCGIEGLVRCCVANIPPVS